MAANTELGVNPPSPILPDTALSVIASSLGVCTNSYPPGKFFIQALLTLLTSGFLPLGLIVFIAIEFAAVKGSHNRLIFVIGCTSTGYIIQFIVSQFS